MGGGLRGEMDLRRLHQTCSIGLRFGDFHFQSIYGEYLILQEIHQLSTRGLLATDHVILNHGQVTWTTPELAPPSPNYHTHQREDVSALDRFNAHRCPTRRVFSGTGFEHVAKQATVRYLYHSATAATRRDERELHFLLSGEDSTRITLVNFDSITEKSTPHSCDVHD
ncbi:uncharacterized protein TNCV_5086171 [Trichonephila clavipes]|uniref:Uncharacterized protein n=1 Tax=Trichonephila clavipes TaxID=2585209 RepID=A0A8X6V774_TRICX|nr:uncharacterized protein TNCV_5086171 [Trichonephila clavipes]